LFNFALKRAETLRKSAEDVVQWAFSRTPQTSTTCHPASIGPEVGERQWQRGIQQQKSQRESCKRRSTRSTKAWGRLGRSDRLHLLLTDQQPELLRAAAILETWSKKFDWQKRIKAHEDSIRQGARQARRNARAIAAAPEEDLAQIATLVSAATEAPKKRMGANPVITRPGTA
jgi:hypothetical protein